MTRDAKTLLRINRSLIMTPRRPRARDAVDGRAAGDMYLTHDRITTEEAARGTVREAGFDARAVMNSGGSCLGRPGTLQPGCDHLLRARAGVIA